MVEFTKAKLMNFPRCVLFGHNALNQTVEMCESLQFGNDGVMITGNNTYNAAGKYIMELVSKRYNIQNVIVDHATISNVDKICEVINETNSSFILAVGGGSKIDLGKMASKETKKRFISIPTSVSHDGIASDRASLKSDVGPKSVEAVSPAGIIADTYVINKAPFKFLASGCADVISNLTALKDWTLANKVKGEDISSSAYTISKYAADNLMENCDSIKPNSEEGVWTTLRPIIASGVSMCIAGSSRPTSGSEHLFSHTLDTLYPGRALHGEQCGVGSIMMMKLHNGDWEQIRDSLQIIGAPVTAKELGFTDEEIITALVKSKDIRRDRYTILGDEGLTPEAATDLARITGVI